MRPRPPRLDAAAPRLLACERSGHYSNFGPQEREIRERFSERLGIKSSQVATAANATLGLAGAVAVLGGTRWAVPAFTFPATPAAVITAGTEVIFSDVGLDMVLNVDPSSIDGCVPVAPFGAPPDLPRWADHGRVVHDAAASLGNDLNLSALQAGHAAVFSLHATKVLGSGEGSLVAFGDESDAERFRAWTNFGFLGSRKAQILGINAKMSEIQACYAHAALDGWGEEQAEWREARERVERMAVDVGLKLLRFGNGVNPYAILELIDSHMTKRIESKLEEYRVGSRRWWSGCHRMPAYADLAVGSFFVTDRLAAKTLGIPMFRRMTNTDVEAVRVALERAIDEG